VRLEPLQVKLRRLVEAALLLEPLHLALEAAPADRHLGDRVEQRIGPGRIVRHLGQGGFVLIGQRRVAAAACENRQLNGRELARKRAGLGRGQLSALSAIGVNANGSARRHANHGRRGCQRGRKQPSSAEPRAGSHREAS